LYLNECTCRQIFSTIYLVGELLYFSSATAVAKFQGGGVKCTEWKICDFRQKSPFISETVRNTRLLWITNRKSRVADRSVSVPVTLSDPERRDARGQISPADLYVITRVRFDLIGSTCDPPQQANSLCRVPYKDSLRQPVVWNRLPVELRSPDVSLDVFRKQLKTFLFNC